MSIWTHEQIQEIYKDTIVGKYVVYEWPTDKSIHAYAWVGAFPSHLKINMEINDQWNTTQNAQPPEKRILFDLDKNILSNGRFTYNIHTHKFNAGFILRRHGAAYDVCNTGPEFDEFDTEEFESLIRQKWEENINPEKIPALLNKSHKSFLFNPTFYHREYANLLARA